MLDASKPTHFGQRIDRYTARSWTEYLTVHTDSTVHMMFTQDAYVRRSLQVSFKSLACQRTRTLSEWCRNLPIFCDATCTNNVTCIQLPLQPKPRLSLLISRGYVIICRLKASHGRPPWNLFRKSPTRQHKQIVSRQSRSRQSRSRQSNRHGSQHQVFRLIRLNLFHRLSIVLTTTLNSLPRLFLVYFLVCGPNPKQSQGWQNFARNLLAVSSRFVRGGGRLPSRTHHCLGA